MKRKGKIFEQVSKGRSEINLINLDGYIGFNISPGLKNFTSQKYKFSLLSEEVQHIIIALLCEKPEQFL